MGPSVGKGTLVALLPCPKDAAHLRLTAALLQAAKLERILMPQCPSFFVITHREG